MNVGSLCTGYGGLDMAAQTVFGGQLAWYAEIEPAAARVLEHHHPDVPNHGDLTTTDWAHVEPVDLLTAGWPCQPFSLAGQRKGASDERAIWPHVARAVRLLRPRVVVLENVAAIAAAGELARAAGDLAALGYVGSWRCVRASDVGAPHRRERIFIVAATDTTHFGHEWSRNARIGRPGPAEDSGDAATDTDGRQVREQPVALAGSCGASLAGRAGEAASDTSSDGRGEGRPEPARLVRGSDAAQRGSAPADTSSSGRGQGSRVRGPAGPAAVGDDPSARADWAGYAPAIHRWERALGRPAPAPTVLGRTGRPKLSPFFVEWLMGLPEGHITAVPGLTANQQLKLSGNGVVPQQAEHAIRLMLPHLQMGVAA